MTSTTQISQELIRPSYREIEAGVARARALRAEAVLVAVAALKSLLRPRPHLAPRHVAGCHVNC